MAAKKDPERRGAPPRMKMPIPGKTDCSNFFLFADDIAANVFRAELDLPAVGGILTGETELPGVVTGHHAMGRRIPGDVIGSTHGLTLLSDRVLQLMSSAGFTGWRSKPCRLKTKRGGNIDGYNLLLVNGRCGALDWGLGEKTEYMTPAGTTQEFIRGATFELSTWDRSDLFVPAETSHVVVTERVKSCFDDNRISGAWFRSLSEHRTRPQYIRS